MSENNQFAGTGTIAFLRHPMPFASHALGMGGDGWMPPLSDPPWFLQWHVVPSGAWENFRTSPIIPDSTCVFTLFTEETCKKLGILWWQVKFYASLFNEAAQACFWFVKAFIGYPPGCLS